MDTVYLETTIIGYLGSRPSRDLITAANQQLTHEWWSDYAKHYHLFVSEAVLVECSAGAPEAAQQRLDILTGIPILDIDERAETLADILVRQIPLPAKAQVDALHIAIAAVNGIDYLLTWNCAHICNAVWQHRIEAICRATGYDPPTICTPQQLKA